MLLNEFSENYFIPCDDKQLSLVEGVKQYRSKFGTVDRAQILKALERTRPYTRTVYPQDWSGAAKQA